MIYTFQYNKKIRLIKVICKYPKPLVKTAMLKTKYNLPEKFHPPPPIKSPLS